jgi:hypothetical protein
MKAGARPAMRGRVAGLTIAGRVARPAPRIQITSPTRLVRVVEPADAGRVVGSTTRIPLAGPTRHVRVAGPTTRIPFASPIADAQLARNVTCPRPGCPAARVWPWATDRAHSHRVARQSQSRRRAPRATSSRAPRLATSDRVRPRHMLDRLLTRKFSDPQRSLRLVSDPRLHAGPWIGFCSARPLRSLHRRAITSVLRQAHDQGQSDPPHR